MKTNYFLSKKALLKCLSGLLIVTLASCGTYQNKSYYDNDGIYGGSNPQNTVRNQEQTVQNTTVVSENSNKYKDYFGSQANKYDIQQSDVLTDVDGYSSNYSENGTQDQNIQSYSGWGNNANDPITVNIYGNNWNNGWGWNNWGWNNGWGWSGYYGNNYWGWNNWNNGWGWNGFYGNNWNNGWGWNGYYGNNWGYNNWYGNGYYGNDYVYSRGRRGSNYSDRYGSGRGYGVGSARNFNEGRRDTSNNRGEYTPRTNQISRRGNARSDFGTNNYNYTPRSTQSPSRNNSDYSTPRATETPRSNQSQSPRQYNTTRSYDSSRSSYPSSSGSSRSSSGGGGGRSGGGGRRG